MAVLRTFTCVVTWLAVAIAHADEPPPPSEPMVSPDGAAWLSAISLAAGFLEIRAPQDQASTWVAALELHREACGARGWLSISTRSDGYIGGNSHGFVGSVDIVATAGPRIAFALGQSLFARGGLELSWLAAGLTWFELDVPRVELGYQLSTRNTLIDFGADSAFALGWGSLDPWTRSPPPFAMGPLVGGHVHWQHRMLRLRLDGGRLLATTAGKSLPRDRLRASLCAAARVGVVLLFCAEAASFRGEARPDATVLGNGSERVWYSVLFTAGVGLMGTR